MNFRFFSFIFQIGLWSFRRWTQTNMFWIVIMHEVTNWKPCIRLVAWAASKAKQTNKDVELANPFFFPTFQLCMLRWSRMKRCYVQLAIKLEPLHDEMRKGDEKQFTIKYEWWESWEKTAVLKETFFLFLRGNQKNLSKGKQFFDNKSSEIFYCLRCF